MSSSTRADFTSEVDSDDEKGSPTAASDGAVLPVAISQQKELYDHTAEARGTLVSRWRLDMMEGVHTCPDCESCEFQRPAKLRQHFKEEHPMSAQPVGRFACLCPLSADGKTICEFETDSRSSLQKHGDSSHSTSDWKLTAKKRKPSFFYRLPCAATRRLARAFVVREGTEVPEGNRVRIPAGNDVPAYPKPDSDNEKQAAGQRRKHAERSTDLSSQRAAKRPRLHDKVSVVGFAGRVGHICECCKIEVFTSTGCDFCETCLLCHSCKNEVCADQCGCWETRSQEASEI